MCLGISSTLFLASFIASANSGATTPVVSLPYARCEGFHNSTSGLDVFLGVRYAQAPVGDLRWRAPKAPLPLSETLKATSRPAKCPQRMVSGTGILGPPDPIADEDCLFLNVYTPRSSTTRKDLPVLVWIHGGGYSLGDAASFDPAPMIRASNFSFVAVIIQYRLGMLGFLPGSEVKKNGALNAGLLDIQFALKWTRKNIHLFGGNPHQVTIWGESAGGGAALLQFVANGGKTSPSLFKRAIASSPYFLPSYKYNDPEPDLQYAGFVNNTGCSDTLDALECLRGLDQVALVVADNQTPRPVIDGTFLTQRPQLSLENKQVNGGRIISLHNADEGGLPFLVPQNETSTVRSWVIEQFPRLSQQNVATIEDAYSLFASNNASEVDNVYKIQTMIFGEAIIGCPSLWLADAASNISYKGLFAVPPALHGLDLEVYFPNIGFSFDQPAQPISESLIQSFMGALVSFVVTGSPNNNPMSPNINPEWAVYSRTNPKEMVFNVTTTGIAYPRFKQVDSGLFQRCGLWAELAAITHQ